MHRETAANASWKFAWAISESIEGADIVVLEGSGHITIEEQPYETLDALRRLLQGRLVPTRTTLSRGGEADGLRRLSQCFSGAQPYALAQAPPISIARSLSLRRSVRRNGSTACS